ncbi:M48 family metallopeptidase [Brevundimonas bacteroides]|uniref:M48 family metallopeptidase n=1 Tax=Brevundimonas bacteroides TaxID=74311 RepID=UPI0004958EC9|nr:SprT family zinc-dependent metalloprotease [Brevundimonas bacteroides]
MKNSAPYRTGQRLPLEGGGALRLSVNPRARRISVRIDGRRGEAVAVAPSERRLADAVAFARSKSDWIAERLSARPAGAALEPGAVIPVEGRPVRLEATSGTGAARLVEGPDGARILSGGDGEAFSRRVLNLLKRLARQRLSERTEVHRRALGQGSVTIAINDAGTRWGSCTPRTRSIRYSWRVILAPPAILDYLAAHEVAHLVHADHSPAYWSVVRGLIGDHRPHRAWLRANGAALHAVGR